MYELYEVYEPYKIRAPHEPPKVHKEHGKHKAYKVLDLFAGAGGLSLGFSQTGEFRIAVAVENNPDSQRTYKCNYPSATVLGDIQEIVDYEAFSKEYGEFDVIIGGPPCQGFSKANRQKNHIISQNNSLIKKFVEVIEKLSPQAFLMENVPMLCSDIHRFYYSEEDRTVVDDLGVIMRNDDLLLSSTVFQQAGLMELIGSPQLLSVAMLPEKILHRLRLLLKNSLDVSESDRLHFKEKNRRAIIHAIKSLDVLSCADLPGECATFRNQVLDDICAYLDGQVSFGEIQHSFRQFVEMQMLFYRSFELYRNGIIIDQYIANDTGIKVAVKSYSILEYISKRLGKQYNIEGSILNSAWFGVPQLRERYIAIGVKKEFCINPELPMGVVKREEFRTVKDAIGDLCDVSPGLMVDQEAIKLESESSFVSSLTPILRDMPELHNHIATNTSETALKRFEVLKQGQNFHNLDRSLIENTYSKPERTQNSIYLRLKYDEPSGTVMNVRKSMWIHPVHNRAISIREAARLQSFPDSFIFIGTKDSQYQQVGNAVPPLMAKAVADKVLEYLKICGV